MAKASRLTALTMINFRNWKVVTKFYFLAYSSQNIKLEEYYDFISLDWITVLFMRLCFNMKDQSE
jgi:hypothetical protein